MAIPSPAYWYLSSVGYAAVTAWATGVVTTVGMMVRPTAASTNNERVFICFIAGTTGASEPGWVITKGAKTTDNTVQWMECTGQAAVNGSTTYTSGWTNGPGGVGTGVKNQAVALGYIIANDAGTNYQICTTAGTAGNGSQPAFSSTAGTTTADNTVTWTSLGVVGGYTTAFGAPHARLANSLAANWGRAGDIFWAADNHAETQTGNPTFTFPGTTASKNFLYCVDRTKTTPGAADLLTTASFVTTNGQWTINGCVYVYGFSWDGQFAGTAQSGMGSSGTAIQEFEACALKISHTNAYGLTIGNVAQSIIVNILLTNTTLSFASTGGGICIQQAKVIWRNTASALTGAAVPTTLFGNLFTGGGNVVIDGVDLSAAGSGNTLVSAQAVVTPFTFVRCKLGASVTVAATPTSQGSTIDAIQCDSGATSYFQGRFWYEGTLTQETTIVRTSGASDGTTPISWKIVSTANSTWLFPFQSFPIAIWNDTTSSSVTATVEIQSSTTLKNDDCWMEIEYLGSALTPQASFANNTKANNLATGSALTTSTKTWNAAPATPIKQKLAVTFTPQMKGYIYARVYVAKASTTLYVDPLITLS